ncbi:hypothetical protein AB1N83_010835 [Pleurotus pulmonarius]
MSSVELTDERKKEIGQHFVFGFIGVDLDENLRRLIQDYYVGHLILMKRNVRDNIEDKRKRSGVGTVRKQQRESLQLPGAAGFLTVTTTTHPPTTTRFGRSALFSLRRRPSFTSLHRTQKRHDRCDQPDIKPIIQYPTLNSMRGQRGCGDDFNGTHPNLPLSHDRSRDRLNGPPLTQCAVSTQCTVRIILLFKDRTIGRGERKEGGGRRVEWEIGYAWCVGANDV